jgi:hypothetical protein
MLQIVRVLPPALPHSDLSRDFFREALDRDGQPGLFGRKTGNDSANSLGQFDSLPPHSKIPVIPYLL